MNSEMANCTKLRKNNMRWKIAWQLTECCTNVCVGKVNSHRRKIIKIFLSESSDFFNIILT